MSTLGLLPSLVASVCPFATDPGVYFMAAAAIPFSIFKLVFLLGWVLGCLFVVRQLETRSLVPRHYLPWFQIASVFFGPLIFLALGPLGLSKQLVGILGDAPVPEIQPRVTKPKTSPKTKQTASQTSKPEGASKSKGSLFGKLKTFMPKPKGKTVFEGEPEGELKLESELKVVASEGPASEGDKPKAPAQGKTAAQEKSPPLVKAKPVDESPSSSALRKAQPIQDEEALRLFNAAGRELSEISSHDENKFANKNAMNLAVQIVDYALQMRASDILIDPKSPAVNVIRLRIDGSLRAVKELPVETCRSIINSLKVVSGMNLSERRQPQTGFFKAKKGDVAESFRVASVGILNGERLSLRMLNRNLGSSTLEKINVPEIQQSEILKVLQKNTGMIVVCGPADSGKTTTLYSMLNHLDRDTNHVISLEDPIEATLENAEQHAIDFRKKGAMATLLRNTVIPKDPEVILVGDIPDAESACLLLQAAQTGHLVLACVQANSNAGALSQLLDLGTPPDLLAAGLDLLISQRLLRRLCDSCKKPAQLSPSLLQGFQSKSIDTSNISEPGKCKRCGETGYFGRFAIYDMLTMTDSLRQEIVNNSNISNVLLTEGEKKGCLGLKSEAIRNVVAGVTSLEELKRVVG